MKKADLHIHSTVSDGSDTIKEIIAKAEKKSLDAIAITDHDTLSHANQIPQSTNLKVIAGIEISAYDFDTNTRAHILGYNIKNPELVTAFVQPLLEKRNENSLKQIEVLCQNGFNFDLDKIKKADGKYIYKQHIMNYLVQTGQVPNMVGTFYMNTFKNGGICDFDIQYLDVFDAVKIIKSAGGLAVLAHSGQQQNFYLIDKLAHLGLD